MSGSSKPVVLIVEDEVDVASTYEYWLSDDYDVRRAHDGREALAELDDSVEVVLLDRMIPGMSGEVVLEEIRDRDVDCRVAMVTAVDPGFDVTEMGFDEYITKPPSGDQLRETVSRLLDRSTLDDDLQEYYSLVARQSALESEFSSDVLAERDEYAELTDRIDSRRAAVDERLGDMGSDDNFVGSIREIADDRERPGTETGDGGE